MINRYLVLLTFLLCILATNSCKQGAASTNGNAAAPASKDLKLAFVTNNASDYWTIARKGVEKADAELTDVTVEFKMLAAAQQTSKNGSWTIWFQPVSTGSR